MDRVREGVGAVLAVVAHFRGKREGWIREQHPTIAEAIAALARREAVS